jgi:hypothetical protein
MDIPKLVLNFIKSHHPEAGVSIGDESGFVEKPGNKHIHGYASTVLSGYNWELIIGHAVTLHPVYRVTADYDNGRIIWSGQIIDGNVEETGYEHSSL